MKIYKVEWTGLYDNSKSVDLFSTERAAFEYAYNIMCNGFEDSDALFIRELHLNYENRFEPDSECYSFCYLDKNLLRSMIDKVAS